MIHLVDTMLSLVLLSVLFSFSSNRLLVLIRILAFQGVVVSVVPLFIGQDISGGTLLFTFLTMAIRGAVIPVWLHLAIKQLIIEREVETTIGYHLSMLAGLGLIVSAIFVSQKFTVPSISHSVLLLPAAISLLLAGIFLLIARRNAIVMVLGYIMMENGIYLVGTTFSIRTQHIVEFGILLDILAAVMIMAVILRSIKQEFNAVDTALLSSLKE